MTFINISLKTLMLYLLLGFFYINASQVEYRYNLRGELINEKADNEFNYYAVDALGNRLSISKVEVSSNLNPITLTAPDNYSIKNLSHSITFTWLPIKGASYYDFWFGDEPGKLRQFKTGITATSLKLDFSHISDSHSRYWNVVAHDGKGANSKSPIYTFSALDSDRDQLPDHIEDKLCMSSQTPDSDNDGLLDSQEMRFGESIIMTSLPCLQDSDFDGIEDAYEVEAGSDPMVVDSYRGDNWSHYVDWITKKHEQQQLEVISERRLLDVRNTNGYAISGFAPGSEAMSMTYWVKHAESQEQQTMGSDDDSGRRFYSGIDQENSVTFGVGNKSVTLSKVKIEDEDWTHVALVYSSSVAEIYINGQLKHTMRSLAFKEASQYALWIGARHHKRAWQPESVEGVIDNLSVWNVALSQQDVAKSMFSLERVTSNNLLGFYDFNESRGEWVKNRVTNKFDLKLVAGAKLKLEENYIDSDSDGIPDIFESALCSDSHNSDSDADGIPDGEELGIGSSLDVTSNPCNADTDNDGIADGFEYHHSMNPAKNDALKSHLGSKNSYWQKYVSYVEKRDSEVQVIEEDRHFDVTGSNTYAISGLSNNKEDFSLMYWFKPKDKSEQYSGFDGKGWHQTKLGIGFNNTIKGIINTSFYPGRVNPNITLDNWHHFAFVWGSNTYTTQVYLDGNLAYSSRVPTWFNRKEILAIWIGALNDSSQPKYFMNGILDNVQIWNQTLEQHQVRRYMTEAPQVNIQGLVASYDFSKSRGNWVMNQVSGRFDLKLTDVTRLKPEDKERDSDGDGLSDAFELGKCLDVYSSDSDEDGILDKNELTPLAPLKSTDPCISDTDNDGIDDKFEQDNGMDPTKHDLDVVLNEKEITNWGVYAEKSVHRLLEQGKKVQHLVGELNLSNSLGYAISDIQREKNADETTLMYWFKPSKQGLDQFSGVQTEMYKGSYLGISGNDKPLVRSNYQELQSDITIKSGQWIHLAIVISQSTQKFFVNGQLEQIIDKRNKNFESSYTLWFGAVNYKGLDVKHQNGQVDDIQLWNKALNQRDIINYMRKRPDSTNENLVAWYDFSNHLGAWVKNRANGKYDLKLVKGAHIIESEQTNDSDRDGLSDEFEATYCTDPEVLDSDGDGLSDGYELNQGFLINGQKFTTNPCSSDTDNDGIDDAFEISNGMNPTLADGHIIGVQGQLTHWERYIEELNQSDAFQSASEQTAPGVFDVEGSKGYAITGYYPASHPVTIMFWYKPNEKLFVYDQSLSGVTDVNSSSSLALGQSMYGVMYRTKKYGEQAYDHDLVNEQWNHIALTIGGEFTTLYVNGQQALLSKNTLTSIAYPFFLGAANFEGLARRHMNGKLDNVMKWQRELTREEVRRFMITSPNPESDSTLEWLYRFDDTKNGWAKNEVTNLYDLKLVHGAKISAERPFVDLDKDGLDDKLELASCLDETQADTDGDGLLDGQEYGVNSQYLTITDPCLWDSDRDNIPDDFELEQNSDPLQSNAGKSSVNHPNLSLWEAYAQHQVEQLSQDDIIESSRSLQLTDNNGYAITNHFSLSHDMTLMFWVKYQPSKEQRSGNMDTHKLGFSYDKVKYGDERSTSYTAAKLNSDEWAHLALVLSNQGKAKLYFNGQLVDEKYPSRADLPNVWATYLGAVNDVGFSKEHMKGLLDNVGIWERSLNATEIYQYMFTAPKASDSNLAAWYDFTHSQGDWVKNKATGRYDLKLTQGAYLVAEPTDEDTDGDGLVNRLELAFCTDGLTADSDGDGVNDGDELSVGKPFILITNPCDPDSDNDGLTDDFERSHGSDGLITDANFDSNGNGISNWDEYRKIQTEQLPETVVEFGALSASKGYAITSFFPENGDSTLMYWFKSTSEESQLSGVSETADQHYYVGIQYAQKKFAWGEDKSSGYSFREAEYSTDDWNHIALVINDDHIQLYLNGQLTKETIRSWSTISAPFEHALWLGALNKSGMASDFYTGLIDNVQIWDRALSEPELHRFMALHPKEHIEGLIASYDFSSVKGEWVKNHANDQFDLKLVDDIELESHQVNDTDLDTIPDYVEAKMCVDATTNDTDHDGLSDRQELEILVSACDPDIDGDSMFDGFELEEGSALRVRDGNKDSNSDGITNWYSFTDWYKAVKLAQGEQGISISSGALQLDGNKNSHVVTGIYPNSEDKTLMFDIKFNQLKGLLQYVGSDDNNKHRFYIGLNKNGDLSYGVGDESRNNSASLNSEQWYHFTLRYQAPNAQAYIDGQLVGTLSNIRFSGQSTEPITFGGAYPVNAQIDNVQLWNRALTDEELINRRSKVSSGPESSLAMHYDFEFRLGPLIMNKATNKLDALLSAESLLIETPLNP